MQGLLRAPCLCPQEECSPECCDGICADGKLTDMLSFYTLPSTVIGNPTYKTLKAAFMYYTVAMQTPLHQLMTDALILASKGCAASPSGSLTLSHYAVHEMMSTNKPSLT